MLGTIRRVTDDFELPNQLASKNKTSAKVLDPAAIFFAVGEDADEVDNTPERVQEVI